MTLSLYPPPTRVTHFDGATPWPARNAFLPLETPLRPLAPALADFLAAAAALTGQRWELLPESAKREFPGHPHSFIVGDRSLPPEGYRLCLGPHGISLFSRDWRGAFYGLQTLRQIVQQSPEHCPHLEVEDLPVLAERGYMLDCSRCRVPTMDRLEQLIKDLAALKFNQLQLYLEHTFAFPGHEVVWGDASPFTAEELRYLDRFAAEHAIELVPNFNAFGHFERWLRHPEYFDLAECPYGWRRPDGHGMPWGSTLAPTAESLAFLRARFAEFLPLFRSARCNLGGDEPWELGMGRSRPECSADGKGVVYRRFLNAIAETAAAHKSEIQFWADCILEDPSVVADLDPRLTALVWGYEAKADLGGDAAVFAAHGIPFLLCPGTSTWNALGTRLTNAAANLAATAEAACTHGARGLLLTDWGDYGHHQPPVVSLPPLFLAAAAAWSGEVPPTGELAGILTRHGARRLAPAVAEGLLALGALNDLFAFQPPNRAALTAVLTAPESLLSAACAPLRETELAAAAEQLDGMRSSVAAAPESIERDDLLLTVDLLRHTTRRARLALGASESASAEATTPAPSLRAELTALIGRFEASWVATSRIGGLHESSQYLRTVLASLPTTPPRHPFWPPTAR